MIGRQDMKYGYAVADKFKGLLLLFFLLPKCTWTPTLNMQGGRMDRCVHKALMPLFTFLEHHSESEKAMSMYISITIKLFYFRRVAIYSTSPRNGNRVTVMGTILRFASVPLKNRN